MASKKKFTEHKIRQVIEHQSLCLLLKTPCDSGEQEPQLAVCIQHILGFPEVSISFFYSTSLRLRNLNTIKIQPLIYDQTFKNSTLQNSNMFIFLLLHNFTIAFLIFLKILGRASSV